MVGISHGLFWHGKYSDPNSTRCREKAETSSVLSGYYGNRISEGETMSTDGLWIVPASSAA
jgi:hypothetical protein